MLGDAFRLRNGTFYASTSPNTAVYVPAMEPVGMEGKPRVSSETRGEEKGRRGDSTADMKNHAAGTGEERGAVKPLKLTDNANGKDNAVLHRYPRRRQLPHFDEVKQRGKDEREQPRAQRALGMGWEG